MKVLLQRVSRAAVRVDGETVASIDAGLLVLLGVERRENAKIGNKIQFKKSLTKKYSFRKQST